MYICKFVTIFTFLRGPYGRMALPNMPSSQNKEFIIIIIIIIIIERIDTSV
jgi:hypothetical protein